MSNQRIQVMVPGDQKIRIRALAKQLNCSVSEVYRRAADAYVLNADSNEFARLELEALVEVLEAGITRANIATERAEREVCATLDFYHARTQAREARR